MDSILIIDDEPEYMQGLVYTLELAGFKVLNAKNGASGVDMYTYPQNSDHELRWN